MHAALQVGVELDQEVDRRALVDADLPHVFIEQRAGGVGGEIGGKLLLQLLGVGERKLLGIGLDEEVERVDDGEFGRQVDLDLELRHLFREHDARQPVPVRVLLPVHEMLGRRHFERVGGDLGAAVRRWSQPDRLRPHVDRTVVVVGGDVVKADEDRQVHGFLE